jgi:hypothetical protein
VLAAAALVAAISGVLVPAVVLLAASAVIARRALGAG